MKNKTLDTLVGLVGKNVEINPAPGVWLEGKLMRGYTGDDPAWHGLSDSETEAKDGFTIDGGTHFAYFHANQVSDIMKHGDTWEIFLTLPNTS